MGGLGVMASFFEGYIGKGVNGIGMDGIEDKETENM